MPGDGYPDRAGADWRATAAADRPGAQLMARQEPRVPGGPPPAPIIQRVTIRYAKRGRMRFASHRDVARAIERGVRKAGVPVAYSAGFSPHPRISYTGGAPTGSASEAEYLEISLTRRCEPAGLGRSLDAALPDGIDVVEVVEADGKSAGLQLDASNWEVLVPGVAGDTARRAVDAFMASPSVVVERLTSKGKRQLDARAAVISLDVDVSANGSAGTGARDGQDSAGRHVGTDPGAGCAILRMVIQQMTPAVRPDDVLTALRQISALTPASPPVMTRLWQGPLGQGALDSAVAARAMQATQAAQGLAPDKAMRPETGSADEAPAGPARANEQLSRGERAVSADLRAREPDGRDCPNARNRATESTARSE
ncbi:MAG TPA: TIGR03936 family radical SAM-associated protein [Streptosporangiaceae bacterium]|nr:TIGR03936 family radical SAM-associated protein [Streptosporangiaceae bacterium]